MSTATRKGLTAVAAAIGLWSIAGGAIAAPQCPETLDPTADYKCVFLDVGTDKYGSGQTTTGGFYELGLTGTLATSIYGVNGAGVVGVGSSITDTNRTSVINAAGFVGTPVNYATLSGGSTSISDTATIGQKNIDQLNPLDPGSGDNTQGLNTFISAGNALNGYRLTFDYVFNGTLLASGPKFTGGDLALYYDDLSTAANENIQVLRVNITNSNLNVANLDILGEISFDFNNNGSLADDCTTTFCQNFWNFQTGPQDWYSLSGQGVQITFAFDTNVNPPIPTANQLAIGSNGLAGPFVRQTTLDSSVRFNVPEPTSLALAGLALLGLAAGSARRNRKA